MLKYLCACSNSENHTTSNMCGNCLKDASLLTQMGVEDDEERTGGEALNECSDLNSVFYFIIIIRCIVLQDTGYKHFLIIIVCIVYTWNVNCLH